MNDEYLAGLFDAEGCVGLEFNNRIGEKNHKHGCYKYGIQTKLTLKILLKDAYFSGLFDGDGNCRMGVQERDDFSYGINVNPGMEIHCSQNKELLDAIQEKYGGSVYKVGGKNYPAHRWNIWFSIQHPDSFDRVIDVLLKNCIIKRPQLLILKKVVIPMLKQGEHRTPQGLMKLINIYKQFNPNGFPIQRDWTTILKRNIKNQSLKGGEDALDSKT